MKHRARWQLIGVVSAALAIVITPALLFAHARLVRSTPAANATLAAPPTSISLWFSERPELRFTSIQLLDSAGMAITLGPVAQMTGDPMGVTVPIAQPVRASRYAVVWRTAAGDGHATSGRFTFTVSGAALSTAPQSPAAPPPPAAIPLTPSSPEVPIEANGYPASVRWAEFVALLSVIGTVVFRLIVLRSAEWPIALATDAADRARRLAQAAVVMFIVATLMRIVAQSALVPNATAGRFSAIALTVQYTRWGHGWLVGALGAAAALVALRIARTTASGWLGAALGAIAMALSESLTGHAASQPNHPALATAVDVAHVLGAGGWIGGLLAVAFAGLPVTARLDGAENAAAGSRLVRAYHRAASECVVLVLATACIAVPLRLNAVSDLWGSTYGRTLLLKLTFVAVALGFGLYHWRTAVRPDWSAGTKRRFQRSVSFELAVGALILAVTAALVRATLPPT